MLQFLADSPLYIYKECQHTSLELVGCEISE